MNKKTFFKKLREKLVILDENELNDIIEEYEDTTLEKIKNGKTEEEAIKDFGDIDELAAEILKAYKINPKYKNDKKDPVRDVANDFESFIKKTAQKATEVFNDVVDDIKKNDKNITIEFVFEIIIKVLILLVVLIILRLPFIALTHFGSFLFDFYFLPFNGLFTFLWTFILWLLYIITCALVGMAMFKDNLKSSSKNVKKKEVSKTSNINEDSISAKPSKERNTENGVIKFAIIMARIILFIMIILPLLLVILGITAAIVAVIYHILIGIDLIGILIILIGLFIVIAHIIDIFDNIFKNKVKNYLLPFLIGFIFILVGSFITFRTFNQYDIIDLYPNENVQYFDYNIADNTVIKTVGQYDFVEDESYDADKIFIEVKYYDNYGINVNQNNNVININSFVSTNTLDLKQKYEKIVEELKNKQITNYVMRSNIYVNIYGNKDTLKKLTIKNIH